MYIHCYIFIFIDFFVNNSVVLMSNRRKKRGHPCNIESVVRIRLRKSVFLVWQEKKRRDGYGRQSHSIFAEYLLYSGVHEKYFDSRKRQKMDGSLNESPQLLLDTHCPQSHQSDTLFISTSSVFAAANMFLAEYKLCLP